MGLRRSPGSCPALHRRLDAPLRQTATDQRFRHRDVVDHVEPLAARGGMGDHPGAQLRPAVAGVLQHRVELGREPVVGRVAEQLDAGVVEGLVDEIAVPVSIDTCKSEVARRALESGAHIVNDITALQGDAEMARVVAEMSAGVILMHMRGTPRTMQQSPVYDDVVSDISAWLHCRIEYAETEGIPPDRIIIDPGIGFGKTVNHNLEILRRLDEFRFLKKPILIGTSRKSFIGKILDLPVNSRIEGTAATITWAIAHGADMVRVHDVKAMHRVARMTDALCR